jgi:hypothetical protein
MRRIVCATAVALALMPTQAEAQRRPDLTGQWELVEALATGPGRDGTVSEKPRPTTSTTISGAPFNCGRGCTIVQKGQTLTIANAELADIPGRDKTRPTPLMAFHVNGQQMKVVDSYNWDPPRELPVTARWDGSKVRIESVDHGTFATLRWTQLLSLEDGHLVVVTTSSRDGESRWGTTFRYRKK